jgi:hypothetical protein
VFYQADPLNINWPIYLGSHSYTNKCTELLY